MILEEHLARQMAFSRATFGPSARRKGVCDHITKEIRDEILPEGVGHTEAASEFTDVVLLGLDGMWRELEAAGIPWEEIPALICRNIQRKQAKNEQRNWPDWRSADPDKAIEHDRTSGVQ